MIAVGLCYNNPAVLTSYTKRDIQRVFDESVQNYLSQTARPSSLVPNRYVPTVNSSAAITSETNTILLEPGITPGIKSNVPTIINPAPTAA